MIFAQEKSLFNDHSLQQQPTVGSPVHDRHWRRCFSRASKPHQGREPNSRNAKEPSRARDYDYIHRLLPNQTSSAEPKCLRVQIYT